MEIIKETSPNLHDALVKWVRKRGNDVSEVRSISEDNSVTSSGCDTCGYGSEATFSLWVYYKDEKGNDRATYTSDLSFTELLEELLDG